MTLIRRIYPKVDKLIFAPFSLSIQVTMKGKPVSIDVDCVEKIDIEVGYWRKANQLHAWFVENCQDEVQNCKESAIDYDDLLKLKCLCQEGLLTKNRAKLPSQEGFFFGHFDDYYYYEQLKDAVKFIDALDPDGDHYYRPSW